MGQRVQDKLTRDKEKEAEEMAECTFRPQLATKNAYAKRRDVARARLRKTLGTLALRQKEEMDLLESLHAVENHAEQRLRGECEDRLEHALAQNVPLVDEFLATEKGKTLVINRTQAYLKANEGLSKLDAEQEAITDILTKNKENLKERVMEEFRQRRLSQRRNLSLRKLQAV